MDSTKKEKFFGRESELKLLTEFAKASGSGFVYVRGRRRVGKSRFLKEFKKRHSHVFYFMGVADATDRNLRKDFAKQWTGFTGKNNLEKMRLDALNWQTIFSEVTQHINQRNNKMVLIFDEIQWLCKKGVGFAGRLKEAWLDWQETGRISVVVCGSSTRFFKSNAEGDEKILRGLRTFGDIWIQPFTLAEVKKYYLSSWNLEEICLTYMMFGGIPYYLEQIPSHKGFVNGINDAAFTRKGIFHYEIDEILRLDFNKKGISTIKKILSSLGQKGSHQSGIVNKTGLPQSVVTESMDKLVEYGLVFEKYPMNKKPHNNDSGILYFMKDFFLNFYFQILEPYSNRIAINDQGNLFGQKCLRSETGYYIPDFSGLAFELLVRSVLENRAHMAPVIFSKLDLRDVDYTVGTYWDKESQIDLIVEDASDRLSRLLECKWVSSEGAGIDIALSNAYVPPKNFSKRCFLVLSQLLSPALVAKFQEKGAITISLKDLF